MRPGERLRFSAAATRSILRRYPKAIASGFRRRGGSGRGASADFEGSPEWAAAKAALTEQLSILRESTLAACWLGHATCLLSVGGRTVLTDPVFSHRIGVNLGPMTIGKPRLMPIPLHADAMPPIDLILISHAHFDHLDRPTLKALASPATAVVTARGTRRLIPKGFANVVEMDWEESRTFHGLRVQTHRPTHWGARVAVDRRRRFNAYSVHTSSDDGPDVFYAGDTALTTAFDGIGPFDLAIFGIGAYDPWIHAHATPEQVWTMFRALPAAALLPVHHSTFELSDEPITEPLERLHAAAENDADAAAGDAIIDAACGDVWIADRSEQRTEETGGAFDESHGT